MIETAAAKDDEMHFLRQTGSVEIIEYLAKHGETKQDVLRKEISKNHDILVSRLRTMEALGLVSHVSRECDGSHYTANHWRLTDPKGEAVAALIAQMRGVVTGSLDLESRGGGGGGPGKPL